MQLFGLRKTPDLSHAPRQALAALEHFGLRSSDGRFCENRPFAHSGRFCRHKSAGTPNTLTLLEPSGITPSARKRIIQGFHATTGGGGAFL